MTDAGALVYKSLRINDISRLSALTLQSATEYSSRSLKLKAIFKLMVRGSIVTPTGSVSSLALYGPEKELIIHASSHYSFLRHSPHPAGHSVSCTIAVAQSFLGGTHPGPESGDDLWSSGDVEYRRREEGTHLYHSGEWFIPVRRANAR